MSSEKQFDKAKHAVVEMLRLARNYNQEMTDLRRRMRDVENGMRLTEQGFAKSEPNKTWSFASHAPVNRPPAAQGEVLSAPSRERMFKLYADQGEQIDRRLKWISERRAQLDRLMASLDETELRVINLRWIDGKSWRAVALRIYMCERNGQRIQKRAIEQMARLLEAEWAADAQKCTSFSAMSRSTSASQNLARKS